jgi:DNA-binding MarR family transcriptional regulator
MNELGPEFRKVYMQQNSGISNARASELAIAMRDSCLGARVDRLQRLVGRRFDQELRPLGLSQPQMEVMGALVISGGPVKPSDLAGWLSIERSTMSRNPALLEQRGLVGTTDTSPTGRSLRVEITASGTEAFARAQDAWSAAQEAVLEAGGGEAASTLDTWLDNLAQRSAG